MMIKKLGLTLFYLLFTITAWGQAIKLPLNQRGTDAEFSKTMMVTNVFEFRGDTVANPLDFASAKAEDAVLWRKVKAPAMSKNYRKGFTWIFSGEKKDAFSGNHTLLLIENPGWTAFNTVIWTDRNHNLDLTDDGAPDTMKPHQSLILSLDDKPNGFKVALEHFPVSSFPQFSSMNDKAMYLLQGSRRFSGTENAFRIRRLNLIYGNWKSGSDSFVLGVKDVNCNGIYNENGIDEIMIADRGDEFQNQQSCVIEKNKAYLEWNNAAFYVNEVARDGSFVNLKRETNTKLKYILNKGDKLPRFRYAEPRDKSKTKMRRVRRLRGNMLYIYVWHDQSQKHIQDSAELHKLGRLQNSNLKVLMLNYGASSKYLHRYANRYDTRILQGFSSNTINGKLKIKKIPTGILLDKKQRILAVGITPSQVLAQLITAGNIK
jgi:hypothetical protein